MHELAITEEIVAAVTGKLPDRKITLLRLEIGSLSGVVADSVRFCFDLVAEGTNLEGANLQITEPVARCRCRDCGREFAPEGPIMLCPCDSANAEVLSGADLRIISVEVA
jgi:hydrogenase nickel incorporation protein HypA/HybF